MARGLTNGVKCRRRAEGCCAAKAQLSILNGTAEDIFDAPPRPVLPRHARRSPTKDAEGFTVPPAQNDPISLAEREAAGEEADQLFRVDIKSEPIAEEDQDAEASRPFERGKHSHGDGDAVQEDRAPYGAGGMLRIPSTCQPRSPFPNCHPRTPSRRHHPFLPRLRFQSHRWPPPSVYSRRRAKHRTRNPSDQVPPPAVPR